MPEATAKLLDQLNVSSSDRGFDKIAGLARLTSGTVIEKPSGVFPRYFEDTAR